jgi:His-Xaa-Ser system protein HxsD
MNGIKHLFSKNAITIFANADIYPLLAVMSSAFVFTDRAYIVLDGDPQKEIQIRIKGKEKLSRVQLGILAKEFFNELLNQVMRIQLVSANRQMRELVIGSAMLGAVGDTVDLPKPAVQNKKSKHEKEIDALLKKELLLAERGKGKKNDPLKIFVPWEKNNKRSASKAARKNVG